MMSGKHFMHIALALCLCGCSVKTDRTECPCLVRLSLSGGAESAMDVLVWSPSGMQSERVFLSGRHGIAEMLCDKGELKVSALSGIHRAEVLDGRLIIREGDEMDELYAQSCSVNAGSDVAEVELSLHKQHAYAYLCVDGASKSDYPYYLSVEGNVCGVDLVDLSPIPGRFNVLIRPYLGEYHRICLPRQMDSSLTLQFFNKDMTKSDGSPLESLPLGKYIINSGYDWQSDDLDDIYINVDYINAEIQIVVNPWNKITI